MTTGSNIFSHSIDDASTVQLADTTVFQSDNIQDAMEELDAHVLAPIPASAVASETVTGIVKIATEAETLTAANDLAVISPAKMDYFWKQQAQATSNVFGVVQLATEADMDGGIDSTKAITVQRLNYYADNSRPATEGATGFARLSTEAQATSGSNNTTVMTPLRVKQAIDSWAIGTDPLATTTTPGLIEIATNAEVATGSSNALALTPSNIADRAATTAIRGLFRLPTGAISSARTSNDHVLTPGNLNLFQATAALAGVVKIENNLTSSSTTAALSANQGRILNTTKIGATGGVITGTLQVETITKQDGTPIMTAGKFQSSTMLGMYPIGAVYLSIESANPSTTFGGTWVAMGQGRVLMGAGSATDDNGVNQTFTAGATGGEFSHTLTDAEMPSHNHAGWGEHWESEAPFGVAREYGQNNRGSAKSDRDNYLYNTSTTGGDSAHNNMQPYLVCYMWQRTA